MEERIMGKRAAAPRAKRPSKKKGPPVVQANFDEQLRRFTLAFPDQTAAWEPADSLEIVWGPRSETSRSWGGG